MDAPAAVLPTALMILAAGPDEAMTVEPVTARPPPLTQRTPPLLLTVRSRGSPTPETSRTTLPPPSLNR